MMLAKDLKRIVNQIPDDCAVVVGANYNCDITSFTYDTYDNIAELHLTKGYGIVADKFLDDLFGMARMREIERRSRK